MERLKQVSAATGIPPKRLTWHNFRRFFVCECADRGVPMAMVIEWLGHDDMQVVMHYYNLRDQSSQVAVKRFSEAGRSGLPHDSRQRRPVGGTDPVEGPRVDAGARRRTTPDSLEHLGNEKRNPHSGSRNADSERKTERAGFDLAGFCKLCTKLCLRLNARNDKDLRSLIDVLFLHDFLLSRTGF